MSKEREKPKNEQNMKALTTKQQIHVFIVFILRSPYLLSTSHTNTHKLTCTGKLFLLNLSNVVAPQGGWGHTLCVEAKAGPLSQPIREPGHMAIT